MRRTLQTLQPLQLRKSEHFSVRVTRITHSDRRERNFNSFRELHKLIPDLLETVQADGQTKSKLRSFYRQVSRTTGSLNRHTLMMPGNLVAPRWSK